jgi:hypothetical protein
MRKIWQVNTYIDIFLIILGNQQLQDSHNRITLTRPRWLSWSGFETKLSLFTNIIGGQVSVSRPTFWQRSCMTECISWGIISLPQCSMKIAVRGPVVQEFLLNTWTVSSDYCHSRQRLSLRCLLVVKWTVWVSLSLLGVNCPISSLALVQVGLIIKAFEWP